MSREKGSHWSEEHRKNYFATLEKKRIGLSVEQLRIRKRDRDYQKDHYVPRCTSVSKLLYVAKNKEHTVEALMDLGHGRYLETRHYEMGGSGDWEYHKIWVGDSAKILIANNPSITIRK